LKGWLDKKDSGAGLPPPPQLPANCIAEHAKRGVRPEIGQRVSWTGESPSREVASCLLWTSAACALAWAPTRSTRRTILGRRPPTLGPRSSAVSSVRSTPTARSRQPSEPAELSSPVPVSEAGRGPDVGTGQPAHVGADRHAVREVQLVRGGMDGVELDRCCDVQARLLEPERQSTRPCEEVYGNGALSAMGVPVVCEMRQTSSRLSGEGPSELQACS